MDDQQEAKKILRHIDLMAKTNTMFQKEEMTAEEILHFLSIRMLSIAKSNGIDIKELKELFQSILQMYDEMPLTAEQCEREIIEKLTEEEE